MMAQQTYQIKEGDTLSKVASNYGVNLSDITGYKSGDANKIFAGETVNINTRDIPAANTANAADLSAKPYAPVPEVPKTGYQGLIESTNAAITDLQPKVDQGKKDIESVYDKLGQQSSKRTEGYQDEGVYEKQAAYQKLTNTITARDQAYRRKVEAIQENNPTGQLSSGQQIAIDKATREWGREKADLSVAAAFARDDYTLAKQIVDDKIDAETEGLTTELAGLQYFYSQNYDELSDERKNLLQFQITNVEQELADEKQRLGDISSVQLEAAANGAPASTILAIGKAEDMTDAITAAGQYIGLLDRQREQRLGTGGGGSSTTDITPEDERTLTGAGFTSAEISDLPRAIADFGIDAVLDSLESDAQKAAVKKVYNISNPDTVTRAQIDQSVTQKSAQDWLKDSNTAEELKQLAIDNGFNRFWKSRDAEVKTFLDSPKAKELYTNSLIEQYKAAGMFKE